MAPKIILQFLGETLPFNKVGMDRLSDLADSLQVEYFPKGSIIFRQGIGPVDYVHIIQRGAVKVFVVTDQDHIALRDLGGEGTIIGADWIITKNPPDVFVEAVEDTFCLLAHKEVFLDFLENNPGLAKHFQLGLTEDKISEAYAELRGDRVLVGAYQRFDYFTTKVSQIIKKALVTIDRSSTILQLGQLMEKQGLGSVLVKDVNDGVVGIVTKKDLRTKVVAKRMDYHSPVDGIMSTPIMTIPAQAVCFEAMIKMIREQITHLVVQQGSEYLGIISAHDIMVNQVAAPVVLLRDITSQTDVADLNLFYLRLPSIVRRLIEQGARAGHILTLVALMNDRFIIKVMNLIQKSLGPPPVRFTRLLFGEAGRKETGIYPPNDNGMVYDNVSDHVSVTLVQSYFQEMAFLVANALQSCCSGPSRTRLCSSNPRWRMPVHSWKTYLRDSVLNPIPPDVFITKMILDFRPLYGCEEMGQELREFASCELKHAQTFKRMLATDFLSNAAPLTFFRDDALEIDGSKINSLDVQGRLVDPFANFARLMSFHYSIDQTNTLLRLEALAETGIFSRSTIKDISNAYEFNVQLNILNQLKQLESGITPDSFMAVSDISNMERLMLKDTFSVMAKMVEIVKNRFTN